MVGHPSCAIFLDGNEPNKPVLCRSSLKFNNSPTYALESIVKEHGTPVREEPQENSQNILVTTNILLEA
jgi:hypothetical protein